MLRPGASQDLTQGWAHPSLLPAFASVPQPGHPHCQGHHRLRRSAEPWGEAAAPSNRPLPTGQPPAQLCWTSMRSDSTCPLCPCPWGKLQPFRGFPRGHPVNSQRPDRQTTKQTMSPAFLEVSELWEQSRLRGSWQLCVPPRPSCPSERLFSHSVPPPISLLQPALPGQLLWVLDCEPRPEQVLLPPHLSCPRNQHRKRLQTGGEMMKAWRDGEWSKRVRWRERERKRGGEDETEGGLGARPSPGQSESISNRKDPQGCRSLPGPPCQSCPEVLGPTWPGRLQRVHARGSWHCGCPRPPVWLPGAVALSHVPRQRGLEAVATRQSQRQLESRGLELCRGRCRAGEGPEASCWGAHLSRVRVEALDEIDMAPDEGKGGHLGTDQCPI